MNTSMRFIVAGDIILLQQRSLRVRWYQAVRIAEEVQTSWERAAMLRYSYIAELGLYFIVVYKLSVFKWNNELFTEALRSRNHKAASNVRQLHEIVILFVVDAPTLSVAHYTVRNVEW